MSKRRFPPPWTVDEMNAACFIVRDKNGQALGYFYFEQEPGRRAAANLLTQRRGAAHGGQLRQAPELNVRLPTIKSPPAGTSAAGGHGYDQIIRLRILPSLPV
jgi:hypothetical protein